MAIKMAKQNQYVEFAERDSNGKPITMATDKFRKESDDDVITINGIDIVDDNETNYGIYFKNSAGAEANIYMDSDGGLNIEIQGNTGEDGDVLTMGPEGIQWTPPNEGLKLYLHKLEVVNDPDGWEGNIGIISPYSSVLDIDNLEGLEELGIYWLSSNNTNIDFDNFTGCVIGLNGGYICIKHDGSSSIIMSNFDETSVTKDTIEPLTNF